MKQVTELRKQLREAGIEFQVLKNSLVRRATASAELTELDAVLTGPTAIAFSKDDAVAPAKILTDFAKKNDALKLKGGVVEGQVVDAGSNQSTGGSSVSRRFALHAPQRASSS